MRLAERIGVLILSGGSVVLVKSAEREEKHLAVNPCRNELNLLLVGIFIVIDNASAKEIDRLQNTLVVENDAHTTTHRSYPCNRARHRSDDEVSIAIGGIEQLIDRGITVVLTVPITIALSGIE